MMHHDSKGRQNKVRVLRENGKVVVKVEEMYGTSERRALVQHPADARRVAVKMLVAAQRLEDGGE